MVQIRTALRPLVVLVILALAACEPGGDPAAPEVDPEPEIELGRLQSPGNDRVSLSREISGFGGVYVDGDGQLTVVLTDPGRAPSDGAALQRFAQRHGVDASVVRFRRGDFTYAELETWRSGVRDDLFRSGGVVRLSVDESRNRLAVGVESEADAPAARAAARRLGVPDEAVVIEVTESIHRVISLRDEAPEVHGGYQIHFGNYLCTLGFVAMAGGEASFITNSHCTNRQGGVEGTQYYQPLSTVSSTVIGLEVADPDYFRQGACPRGFKCRYSDAARVLQQSSQAFGLGRIARVDGPGSLNVVGSYPIANKASDCAVVGHTVRKVGRTTGLSEGEVSASCVDISVTGSNILLLNQVLVDAAVGSGDSGSPVFSGSDSGVTLQGILWGGSSSGATFAYSPLGNVEDELGTLVVTEGGTPPPPPDDGPVASFTVSCDKNGLCVFDASASTGSGLTYDWSGIANSQQVTATAQFAGPGETTVGLTVTDDGGDTDSTSTTVTCQNRGPNLQCR